MEPKCVHHVEFGVLNGLKHVQNFLSRYKFRLAGTRITPSSKQWLVTSHAVRFLITELSRSSRNSTGIRNDPYVHSWTFPTDIDDQPVRDSVFNIALRVKNIDGFVNRLSKQNVKVLKPLQTVSDHVGSVRVCMVKSCVGNVVHTLVEDSEYTGFFLPGFQTAESQSQNVCGEVGDASSTQPPSLIDLHNVDHVTFCVPRGTSASMIDWYENCFGMKRFFINREDDDDEGFVISGKDVGMRLKAFEYWKCAETGLATEEKAIGSVKFVVAETLPDQGPNQLDMFLTNHGGAGVQHVGLHTGDIIGTISQLQTNGVKFNEAPYTYYTEVGRLKEMITMGVNVDQIRKNGILVDLEREEDAHSTNSGTSVDDLSCNGTEEAPSPSCNGTEAKSSSGPGNVRYLMQKFTQPLFEADTFYLEVIQRVGATGFGSGNITALWRSLQAYFQEKEAQNSQDGSDKS